MGPDRAAAQSVLAFCLRQNFDPVVHIRSDKPPHSCRAKDVRLFLRRDAGSHPLTFPLTEGPPKGWMASPADITAILKDCGIVISGLGEHAGQTRAIAEIWEEVLVYNQHVITPSLEVFGGDEARRAFSDHGRRALLWWKYLLADAWPFKPEDCNFDVPEEHASVVEGVKFDYKRAALGIASHTLMTHAADVYSAFGFLDGVKVVEEGLDHLFVSLYHMVPLLFGKPVGSLANASTIWQVVVESWVTGVPLQYGSAAKRRLTQNRSYQ